MEEKTVVCVVCGAPVKESEITKHFAECTAEFDEHVRIANMQVSE